MLLASSSFWGSAKMPWPLTASLWSLPLWLQFPPLLSVREISFCFPLTMTLVIALGLHGES